jgi:hypothetical protein
MVLFDVSKIISIDLESYFNDYAEFVSQHNQTLVEYFSKETTFPKFEFDKLDELINRTFEIKRSLSLHKSRLSSYFCFEILDSVETVDSALQLINNYSRWLRSSFVKGRFKDSIEVDFILKQNQTLEQLSSEIGFTNSEEGFINLSQRNHIKETDYNLDGGLLFTFGYQTDQSIAVSTVVDNLFGKNVLGKDISKKLQIKDNDLVCLSPEATFDQTCDILTKLLKNGNPEFPTQGFDKATISNKNSLSNMLPVFLRQLYATVDRDDTIASFRIVDIRTDGDALKIEIEFYSHLSYEVKQTVDGN